MTATIEKPEQKRIELPARSEVAQSDQWDLKSLFTDEAAWEEAFTEGEGRIAALKSFAGRLGEGAQVLRELLDLDTDTDRLVSRLYNYAARRSDEDTSNSHYQGLRERCQNLVTRLSEAMSFFSPELLGLSEETLEGYLGAEELAPFKFTLEKVIRRKPHTLSQSEERLLAMAGEVTNAPYQIFGQLSNADLKFGFITDENGNEVEVTHGSYTVFLNKRDRAIREKFFKTYYQGFESHKHTLSAALQAGIKRDVFYAKAKNHASARSAALFRNNVPEAVYDNLIEAVHENLGGLYKYYELRRELLGLDEIHFYDLFVSVVPDLKMRHTYEEAVAKIIAALAPLGDEYTSTLESGLLGGWVDRYENRGKRSGAYSSGCYDSDPFILMNFKADSLEHTYTLAHEAGHSMHSHYSKKQLPQNADYSIFVAEVASTFNEALLTHYMLETTDDPKMRAFIINREIDGLRGTLFRQTMFAEFEKVIHAKAEANEPLSLDVLTGAYHEILERYYGPNFTLDAELDLECLRIPHFYYNFYVFQYATGISAAIALAKKVIAGEEGALERYLGFLSAGGSKFPIDVLKDAGVDMTQKDAVAAALEHFNARVDELKALRESGAF